MSGLTYEVYGNQDGHVVTVHRQDPTTLEAVSRVIGRPVKRGDFPTGRPTKIPRTGGRYGDEDETDYWARDLDYAEKEWDEPGEDFGKVYRRPKGPITRRPRGSAKLAQERFDEYRDHWMRTADQWFDGTPDSVDRRIALLDRTLTFARNVVATQERTNVGFLCHNALPNLEQSRRELAALRDDLLSGPSVHREAASPGGRRVSRTAGRAECPECGAAMTGPNPEKMIASHMKSQHKDKDKKTSSFNDFPPELMFDT